MTAATKIAPVRFADLTDKSTVVIHAGPTASFDPEVRKVWQRAHNDAIKKVNPLDPDEEPEQTLFVGIHQLKEGGNFYPMADPDTTKRVIIHKHGALDIHKLGRLCRELIKQAPHAEIYRGEQGQNSVLWQDLVAFVKATEQVDTERTATSFPLIAGYEGFDTQGSYLIKGLLPTDSACSIYGPSGSFKSFVAVSMACHVATGTPWDGRHVEEGAVLYIVGEGGVGVPRRIRAWADEYIDGHDIPNFYRIPMPVFMADDAQVAELEIAARQVKAVTGLPVRLIVVDTVARCFGSGDENRAADMGAFIKGCDLIKVKTGATVLMVHHTGKNEGSGARGSSAFRAALDAEFLVKREGGDSQAVTIACTKMKDDEEPLKRAYDLKSRVVCYDCDNDEVTSLVLIDNGRLPVEPEELDEVGNVSANHIAMLQAVRTLCEKQGGKTSWALVIQHMKAAGTWDSKKGSRWREKLIKECLIFWDEISEMASIPAKPEYKWG